VLNLFNNLVGNLRSNKVFLSFSSLFNIVLVSLGGFVSFLVIVVLAKIIAYLLNLTNSLDFGSIDIQIAILGAGMQLSIYLLKKADNIKKNY
jgi:hypothetical protein